jgi:hypothetical protein
MPLCLDICEAEVRLNFKQNFTFNCTIEADFVSIIKSNLLMLFMSLIEVHFGSNLKSVNAFYHILKYHATQFGRNLKMFNGDGMAVILSKNFYPTSQSYIAEAQYSHKNILCEHNTKYDKYWSRWYTK